MNGKRRRNGRAGRSAAVDEAPAAAGDRRFSPQELREIGYKISAGWFSSHNQATNLTLLDVNPRRLHAYWNIDPDEMRDARRAIAADSDRSPLVLRFTDVTPRPKENRLAGVYTFDVEVVGLRNNWYVDLWQPGRRFIAKIGLRGMDNRLHPLARSNEVELPRADSASELDYTLGRYPGARSMDALARVGENEAWRRFQELLPRGSDFPETVGGGVHPTAGEPTFPSNLLRESEDTPQLDPVDRVTRPRTIYGTDFPRTDEATSRGAGVEWLKQTLFATPLPVLPVTDAGAVSPGDLEFTPTPLPIGSAAPASRDDEPVSGALRAADGRVTGFRAIGTDGLRTYHLRTEELASRFRVEHPLDLPVDEGRDPTPNPNDDTRSFSAGDAPAAADEGDGDPSSAPQGPAPRPVLALEDALGASLFSYGSDGALEVEAQLRLDGRLAADCRLTLFGQSVSVDQEGNFSVQIRLDSGPELAAQLQRYCRGAAEPN